MGDFEPGSLSGTCGMLNTGSGPRPDQRDDLPGDVNRPALVGLAGAVLVAASPG